MAGASHKKCKGYEPLIAKEIIIPGLAHGAIATVTPLIPVYLAANLLLALNVAPKYHKPQMPAQPPKVSPASRLTPGPTPKFKNIGLLKWIAPHAIELLAKSLPANKLAAYCG